MEHDTKTQHLAVELVLFFLLSLFAWAIWIPQALYRLGLAESAVSLQSPANALTVWSPGLAAILLTALTLRGPGLGVLLGTLGRWRVGWYWYVVAIFFEPVRWWLALGIERVLGLSCELGPMPVKVVLGSAPGFMIVVAVVFTLPNAIGEEIGWRGFALPRLQAWRGAFVASLVLGVFWGLWHIPAWIGQGLSMGFGPMTVRVLSLVATAFVFTWIYNGTSGSLVPVVMYHASIAAKNYLFPNLATQTDEILLWLFVLVLVASTRSQWFCRTSNVTQEGATQAD